MRKKIPLRTLFALKGTRRWIQRVESTDHVGPVGVEELAAWFVGALVGVGTEEVALGLQQIRRQHGAAVAVVVSERGTEGRNRDAVDGGECHDLTPVLLEFVEQVLEERCQHEVAQFRIAAIGIGDVVEESSADDATTAPDGGDFSEVEVPVFLGTHRFDEVEALGVGNDFRSEQSIVHFFHQLGLVAGDVGYGTLQFGAGGYAFFLHRGKDASFHGGVDGGDHHSVFHSVHDGPFARAFLAGGIEDDIDESLASLGVVLFENFRGDLNEVAFEVTVVPIGEDLTKFGSSEASGFEDVIGLADELHVAVLDAIVDHFHVVTGTAGTDVGHARLTIDFGGNGFEDGLHHIPGGEWAAGHDGGAFAGAFFTTGNTGSDETQAFFREVGVAALGIGVERVAAVDDDITLIEQGDELFDHRIHGAAGFHHDLDFARSGEGLHELFESLGANQFFAGMSRDEFIGGGGGTVVDADLEAARFHVENEILAHDGQSDKSEVAFAHSDRKGDSRLA